MARLKIKGGSLSYEIRHYNKTKQVMTLVHPHTGHSFKVFEIKELLKTTGYYLVK
jgi:hypothetical protein